MLVLPLHPVTTILLLTTGIALVSLEFNRPGLILPGTVGLLITLLAFASILHTPAPYPTLTAFGFAAAALFFDYRRPNGIMTLTLAVACLAGFLLLLQRPFPLSTVVISLVCATLIAAGTHTFNRIARRARRNKGLD